MTTDRRHIILVLIALACCAFSHAQDRQGLWHGMQRTMHYRPDGEDFVRVSGSSRFNRAIYGGHTAFRVEAGDLPEFALYLPGMGGNLKFALVRGDKNKWLIDADSIEARYRPGAVMYTVHDSILGKGTIGITVLSPADEEALMVRVEAKNISGAVQLVAVYGGASGTKFSRDGDLGADPESSFYLKPEYCRDNFFQLEQNSFVLYYGSKVPLTEEERYEIQYQKKDSTKKLVERKTISGIFPATAQVRLADASRQQSIGELLSSLESLSPVVVGTAEISGSTSLYYYIRNGKTDNSISYSSLPQLFDKAELERQALAARIQVRTPDPYINTLGGALSVAGDAVWEEPSYLHGAVAWRMRLNGWRGAYIADVLGWHDRARKHFSSYALSQLTAPLKGPVVADTALHLARGLEKMGTSLFSSGYISRNPGGDQRPHHYDMNLVFIDELLHHFLWTGDKAYVQSMWPLLKRHLEWEKRNFDADGDGLYDAYAAIWASDALQYSGGGVTHSSAYNYRANEMAAELAKWIGEDPSPYQQEANKIIKALNKQLWMPARGTYAEYRDLLGNRLLHPSPAVWTIYHAMDSHVPDGFQAWQSLEYISNQIPHIPVRAKGLPDSDLYTISTTNWQPYTWSLNNVVLGEAAHTALAYWQGGQNEAAFRLWKSALVESMYLGGSPGNFQQISFYDAMRGELYRDFADDIGMTARSLVEGLFGILPDAMQNELEIRPGFPAAWDHASLVTPDISFEFRRKDQTDRYAVTTRFARPMNLLLKLQARMDDVEGVWINEKPSAWTSDTSAVGSPVLMVEAAARSTFSIRIKWKGRPIENIPATINRNSFAMKAAHVAFMDLHDPQKVFRQMKLSSASLGGLLNSDTGSKTIFVHVRQNKFTYWLPVSVRVQAPVEASLSAGIDTCNIRLANNSATALEGNLVIGGRSLPLAISPRSAISVHVDPLLLYAGTNNVLASGKNWSVQASLTNWDIKNPRGTVYDKIDLSAYFNDDVKNIFKHQYLSPRPTSQTLQLPVQGIGNWAYPLVTAVINDSGLRKRAGPGNEIVIGQGVPFSIQSNTSQKNILFTSQWDNFPRSVSIPLKGKARHAYVLMAGSTNPMQSRMENGIVTIEYMDGHRDSLLLKNPENWWPIEQDYYEDGFAFTTGAAKPVRVYLKSGEDSRNFSNFVSIKGFTNRGIDGGAATVLDLALDPQSELKSIQVTAIANDVVIGLMALTLIRN